MSIIKFTGPSDRIKLNFRKLPTPMIEWEGTAKELHDIIMKSWVESESGPSLPSSGPPNEREKELEEKLTKARLGIEWRDDVLGDWCDSINDLRLKDRRDELQSKAFDKTNDFWEKEEFGRALSPYKEEFLIQTDSYAYMDDGLHKELDKLGAPKIGGSFARLWALIKQLKESGPSLPSEETAGRGEEMNQVEVKFVSPPAAPDYYSLCVNGQEVETFEYETDAQRVADKLQTSLNAASPAEGTTLDYKRIATSLTNLYLANSDKKPHERDVLTATWLERELESFVAGPKPSPHCPSVDELAMVMAYQHSSHTPESRKKLWDAEQDFSPWKKQWRTTAKIVLDEFFTPSAGTEDERGPQETVPLSDKMRKKMGLKTGSAGEPQP